MLKQRTSSDPIGLYRDATSRAIEVVEAVNEDQLDWPTPCSEWTVQQLIDHLVLDALVAPGAMERVCVSPLGFDWPLAQAVGGTFMDVLIHTWDLARATGQDERLDPELVQACTAMFVPEMPSRGREAGIIGPEVQISSHASAQDRLLAVMGRTP